jgi:hypothetical protein
VSHVIRRSAVVAALACLGFCALSSSALASTGKLHFRPRIRNAMGLFPPIGVKIQEPSEGGIFDPVTYHGGPTMTGGVTVHTIFWAPSGYSFQGSPGGGAPTYIGTIEQFFSDAAAGSTGTSGQTCTLAACNPFTVQAQYAWGTTPGGITSGANTIMYNGIETTFPSGYTSGDNAIIDTNPYPAGGCVSPEDTRACLTDAQVQAEVDKIVQATSGHPRGLNNLWYVYTPPNVDECIFGTACETTAFGGYHSLSNVGNGVTIYAYTGDALVETSRVYSSPHPEGNADGEVAADISLHEVNEAMSDPTGVGYIDSNAYEIGDKCEFGQPVQPLGYASTGPGAGQPFDTVMNGHKYWTQSIWSQADGGCVNATTNTSNPLPLPQVDLNQYASTVTGNTEDNTAGIGVTVELIRSNANGAPVVVASASGVTNSSGQWTVTLPNHHTVGDDRDEIDVIYSGAGAPVPHHQVILTGNGGDAWVESGWTGFTAMDQGNVLTNNDLAPWSNVLTHGGPSLTMSPCFQTGVFGYSINGGAGSESPNDFCSTSFDTADTPLGGPVARGDLVRTSSTDNRAFQSTASPFPNAAGGLVKLTVSTGEPDSVLTDPSTGLPVSNPLGISPTAPPSCLADLGAQGALCIGLVPGDSYTLTDGSQSKSLTADATGTVVTGLTVKRGDLIRLSNGSRILTALHVANLRVHIDGDSSSVTSGICSPDEYWGGPLTSPPLSGFAGLPTALAGGAALTGEICPQSGSAAGLPTSSLGQTDEQSGGQTVTEVADIADTSPIEGETMTGKFVALAETTFGPSAVSLTINPASGGKAVFFSKNVDTSTGAQVHALSPGNYIATWVVTNPNGDTRTVITRFIEGGSSASHTTIAKPRVACHSVSHKHQLQCNVSFAKSAKASGTVRVRISRGGSVAALGHGRLHNGATTVTMRELRALNSGTWRVTVVYTSSHHERTVNMELLFA